MSLGGGVIDTETGSTVSVTEDVTDEALADVAVIVTFRLLPEIVLGATYSTLVVVAFVNDPHAAPEHPLPLRLQVTPVGTEDAIRNVDVPASTVVLLGGTIAI